MEIVIGNIEKKDYSKIQKFAATGMQFDMYTKSKIELYLYSKYFLYHELNRATQAIAAYMGEQFVGVLLADMNNEQKVSVSFWRKLYVRFAEWVMKALYNGVSDSYNAANKEMLQQYKADHKPDGELNFLAVDPAINGKGIGSILLDELERREKGKLIYLFSNTGCTYQFYDRRGFDKPCTRSIEIEMHGKKIPNDCFLYSKRL